MKCRWFTASDGVSRDALRALIALGVAAALGACRKSEPTLAAVDAGAAGPERGEHVVVEPAAAEFFEARVLEVTGDRVRVQVVGSGDPRTVAASDVYRQREPPRACHAGALGICRIEPQVWVGCRVEECRSEVAVISTAEGRRAELSARDRIAPSAVTELNLRRRFERARDRAEFEAGLARAGSPAAPAGWKPMPAESVLARLAEGWHSAKIHELGRDEIQVQWAGSGRIGPVAARDLIPEPAAGATPRRGDFALARPLSPASAWQPVRVESASEEGLVVRDAQGSRRSVTAKDLVALVPDAG